MNLRGKGAQTKAELMRNSNRLCSPGDNEMCVKDQSPEIRPMQIGTVKLSKFSEIALVGVLLALVGCAGSGPGEPNLPGTEREVFSANDELRSDMVRNLVSVVPQLLEPFSTTIQFNEVSSSDVLPAVEQLVKLGYGMQRVDADQGKYFLDFDDMTLAGDVDKNETRLRVSLGDIELTRSYRVVNTRDYVANSASTNSRVPLVWRGDQTILAAGPILLAGTRLPVKVSGFELIQTASASDADLTLSPSSAQYTAAAAIEGGIPTISLITDELVQQVAQNSAPGIGLPDLSVDSFTLENMTHVFDEAFASLSDNYTRVRRETVIFPNDSQNLGRPGKLIVKKIIGRYAENSDLVGIVGCSNGKTSLSIGNEGLALGRAKRIAEEFYSAGVSRDRVFNEGCWSSRAGTPGFPNRGVVIDLWRRKG